MGKQTRRATLVQWRDLLHFLHRVEWMDLYGVLCLRSRSIPEVRISHMAALIEATRRSLAFTHGPTMPLVVIESFLVGECRIGAEICTLQIATLTEEPLKLRRSFLPGVAD